MQFLCIFPTWPSTLNKLSPPLKAAYLNDWATECLKESKEANTFKNKNGVIDSIDFKFQGIL